MTAEEKREYFQKIAGARANCILEGLDSLGNCANPATYDYDLEDVSPMFTAIIEKIEETWLRLSLHSPHASVPFHLQIPDPIELVGHRVSMGKLASMEEVTELMEEGAPSFSSLEPIRARYQEQFGDELCWTVPVFHDGFSGCVLLPVQEGIMYFPYQETTSDTYEQFDLQGMGLLTSEKLQNLQDLMRHDTVVLLCLLASIKTYGLAKEE